MFYLIAAGAMVALVALHIWIALTCANEYGRFLRLHCVVLMMAMAAIGLAKRAGW